MAPSAIAEVKETHPPVTGPTLRSTPRPPSSGVEGGPALARALFNDALIENHRFKSSSKTLDFLVALLFHVAVIGGPIFAGLYYTDTLNLKAFATTHPQYPTLARQAHIQGQVQIDAILDEQGNVIDMKVVSGPPLLYQAALDALKKWRYEPTYLNDQPIAVEMMVMISFQLG